MAVVDGLSLDDEKSSLEEMIKNLNTAIVMIGGNQIEGIEEFYTTDNVVQKLSLKDEEYLKKKLLEFEKELKEMQDEEDERVI